MLDDISVSDTVPVNDIRTDDVEFSHEATIGKLSDKAIFYDNKKTKDMLYMEDEERPIAQQIFGSDVDTFVIAAKYI